MGRIAQLGGYAQQLFAALAARIFPPAPQHIQPALEQAQFVSIRKQVPMLLSVAALNASILIAVCAHQGLPLQNYVWMSGLVAYALIRLFFWKRQANKAVDASKVRILLKTSVVGALLMLCLLGAVAAYTFVAGTFGSSLLIPVSLGFGATSIAHCLYTLRPAAIGSVILGLMPTSAALIAAGSFEAQMLGVSMISVGILMIRFVIAQYDQLIVSILLADENRTLALIDPLTGISNRRAIMAALDQEAEADSNFALALIDLDGFKQVNDTLGHNVGDQLLCAIAERLSHACEAGDAVGRLGGDEFIALFRNLADEAECSARANGLLAGLCAPIDAFGERLPFGASLGFAINRIHGDSVEALLHSADQALYSAKRTPAHMIATTACTARRAV